MSLSKVNFLLLCLVLCLPILHPSSSFAQSISATQSDLDSSGKVDIFDYNILLTNYGKAGSLNADIDKNGKVDIFDFSVLLSHWGTTVATASPSNSATTAMIEGVPICSDHDKSKWHPLVKRDTTGTISCTYGHEHHDDPNLVNDIFGPPSVWYGGNQEISYPWQTFAFTTPQGVNLPTPPDPADPTKMENHLKHEGYKWIVIRDMPCAPFWGHFGPPHEGCIISVRVQMHTRGDVSDAVTRFHSFSMEALVDYKGKRGIVRHGGWLDFGFLFLLADGGGPGTGLCPSVPTNPPTFSCKNSNAHRDQSSKNVPSPHVNHIAVPNAWYANHSVTSLSTVVETWGPVDYTNPSVQLFHTANKNANGSSNFMGNMAVSTTQSWLAPYIKDGLLNFNGFTDRHGNQTTGCSTLSIDCVPLKIENVPAGSYIWNAGFQQQAGPVRTGGDFDVMSPVTGKSLITFPN